MTNSIRSKNTFTFWKVNARTSTSVLSLSSVEQRWLKRELSKLWGLRYGDTSVWISRANLLVCSAGEPIRKNRANSRRYRSISAANQMRFRADSGGATSPLLLGSKAANQESSRTSSAPKVKNFSVKIKGSTWVSSKKEYRRWTSLLTFKKQGRGVRSMTKTRQSIST